MNLEQSECRASLEFDGAFAKCAKCGWVVDFSDPAKRRKLRGVTMDAPLDWPRIEDECAKGEAK